MQRGRISRENLGPVSRGNVTRGARKRRRPGGSSLPGVSRLLAFRPVPRTYGITTACVTAFEAPWASVTVNVRLKEFLEGSVALKL